WTISSILNNNSYIITLIVQLNGTGNISNIANVTGTDQNNTGNNSSNNNSTVNVTPSINLSIVKTVNVSGVVLNGVLVEYTINVTNHGPDTATNVNITDVLDDRLIFVSANGSYTRVGQAVSWTISSILNNNSYIITLIVQLNGTGNISNIANVTGTDQNNTGNNSSNNNSTVNVTPSINLSIVKTVNVSGVVLNGVLVEYTINV
ncbi:DUF11 domain-containing protein, partial [Methanobrevibacter curvatus]|uniref:DUF11 domain-containing protein n=1 Tax=Methanobrevibacter curvatus TaxID=49547 RepID=UPI001471338D